MAKVKTPRWAWALTGSGHFFKECLRILRDFGDVDLFVSKAASEVVRLYRPEFRLPPATRFFRDTTASAAPVSLFYYGTYHTLILAPATSNTIAKCVMGISDVLVTNVFAQAGKCRLPAIVFACDTAPELETEAPKGQMGFMIVGNGSAVPWRVRIRSSSYCNLSVASELCRGCLIADVPAIIGSLDIVLGEIDR